MNEIFELINEMSPFILLGFILAGLLHSFVPNSIYKNYIGKRSIKSVINAAILGIPLPLCSCGTIPTAMSLRKEGASKGATIAFLISTPQTGIDSIIATYSIIGLPFAILRPIAALVLSITSGIIVNKFAEKETDVENNKNNNVINNDKKSFIEKIKAAIHYAFIEMMQDIGKWLILGLLIASAITLFIPDSFFEIFTDNSLLSMLFVLIFSIPMYICATGSIPIAAALMLKGLSPGTALVLLMAGPAINAASVLIVSKVLGKRTLILYLLTILLGSMTFGIITDYVLPPEWFTIYINRIKACNHEHISLFNIACTIIMITLLTNALILRYHSKKCCCHNNNDQSDTTMKQTNIIIQGMQCNHCKNNVEKVIKSVEGVKSVEIDLKTGNTIIIGNANINDIKDAINSIGFDVN